MVTEIPNIVQFLHNISSNGKFKFAGNYIRISAGTTRDKLSLQEYFKQSNVQHYVIPHREIALEVVIPVFPRTLDLDSVKKKKPVCCKDFTTLKTSQIKTRRDERPFPYLMELPKSITLTEIFNVDSIFNLLVELEKFRLAKKATLCFHCQKFFHISANCHINPKCVGCGAPHLTQDSKVKQNTSTEIPKPPKMC